MGASAKHHFYAFHMISFKGLHASTRQRSQIFQWQHSPNSLQVNPLIFFYFPRNIIIKPKKGIIKV